MPCIACHQPLFTGEKDRCLSCSLAVVKRWILLLNPLFFVDLFEYNKRDHIAMEAAAQCQR